MREVTLNGRNAFIVLFITAGFITKILSEFVHEIFGHGLFVLLFGGKITHVYVSVLWPYDFSYIGWTLPNDVTLVQIAWVYAGGILACLFASFLTQAFLLLKKIRWHFALPLFWFAFWTLVNSTGYLIIGGLTPFGDVKDLINLGVLESFHFLVVGLTIFVVGFIVSSWILRRTLLELFAPVKASLGVALFWLIIPLLIAVMLANPERGLQSTYLPLSFIPTLLSSAIEYFLILSK